MGLKGACIAGIADGAAGLSTGNRRAPTKRPKPSVDMGRARAEGESVRWQTFMKRTRDRMDTHKAPVPSPSLTVCLFFTSLYRHTREERESARCGLSASPGAPGPTRRGPGRV